jgi:hypothetical protein
MTKVKDLIQEHVPENYVRWFNGDLEIGGEPVAENPDYREWDAGSNCGLAIEDLLKTARGLDGQLDSAVRAKFWALIVDQTFIIVYG